MTPRELLQLQPQSQSHDIESAYSHLQEADTWDVVPDEDDRIEVREYASICFDGTRSWELGSVWFDGKPVLIFQEAGRSRSDHYTRWIVDPDQYWEMVKYSYELPRKEDASYRENACAMDEEVEGLTFFYGQSLDNIKRMVEQQALFWKRQRAIQDLTSISFQTDCNGQQVASASSVEDGSEQGLLKGLAGRGKTRHQAIENLFDAMVASTRLVKNAFGEDRSIHLWHEPSHAFVEVSG